MKCPYFDCKRRDFGEARPESWPTHRISDHVFCCPCCGRLSLRCKNPECDALNRPFTVHCRRCPDVTAAPEIGARSSRAFWEQARRSGLAGFPGATEHAAPAVILADLSKEFPGASRTKAALEFLDGLLAVHLPGGMALVHPFGDLAAEGAGTIVFRKKEEPQRIPERGCPFPPLKVPDDRHILFSHPRAVYAVHAWSLPGWAFERGAERFQVLMDWGSEADVALACPPVVWDAMPRGPGVAAPPTGGLAHPVRPMLGVITRVKRGHDAIAYYWAAFDFASLVHDRTTVTDLVQRSVRLPVTGARCRIETVGNQVLTLATPHGHWAWKVADAAIGDLAGFRSLLPREGDAPQTLVMHRHDQHDRELHALRHYVQYDRSHAAPRTFRWYYLEAHGATTKLKCYTVDCDSLNLLTNPCDVENADRAIPLGAFAEGLHGESEMLFACRTALGTKLRQASGLRLQDLPKHGPLEDLEHASGVVFRDPTLAVVMTPKTLIVRSLAQPNSERKVEFAEILTDPLIWSRWLFTVDDAGDGRLAVRRRDLLAPSRPVVP